MGKKVKPNVTIAKDSERFAMQAETEQRVVARRLTDHIRRCCAALADGAGRARRKSIAFWLAQLDVSAKHWRYPVLRPEIRQACDVLGIHLGREVKENTGVAQLSAFLHAVTEPLAQILTDISGNFQNISVHSNFQPNQYQRTHARLLPEAFVPLQKKCPDGVTLFLHGSMADGTHTPFSDVDDLVILDRRAWQTPERLQRVGTLLARLARAYQDIDPFQHHGHWVLTEFDLMHLDQSYLPLVVLENAVRVIGNAEIQARVQENTEGFKRNAVNTLRSMERTLSNAQKQGGVNAFILKGLVGEIALIPAYLFQTQGEMMNKPEAIAQASDLFSQDALPALGWATRVRDEFGTFVEHPRTRLLQRIASLTCARRYQAEWLFRRYAPWVSNQHNLGLEPEIVTSIRVYMQESRTCLKRIKP